MPKKRKPSARSKVNVAESLTEDERKALGSKLILAFNRDAASRTNWYERCQDSYKLASVLPTRSEDEKPWDTAANVVVPIVASTVLQMAARAYAAMFEQGYPERVRTLPVSIGDLDRARKQEQYLNWQTIVEMEEYESEWDLALMDWPVFGHVFKKVTWDHDLKRPVSIYAPATDVYVPYGSRYRLSTRSRVTHLLPPMLKADLEQMGKDSYFIDVGECKPGSSLQSDSRLQRIHDEVAGFTKPTSEEEDTDFDIIEVHFFGELKDGGEKGFWKAWVDLGSQTLLRVVSREVEVGGKNHIIDEFVSVPFIPNPRGPYGVGFGAYLGPLNEIANTLFNQFIDAGSLANQPFVFYTRVAGASRRDMRLFPGAWVPVNALDEVREGKLPGLGHELPTLLSYINEFSRDLSSVSEEMTGRSQKGVREPTVRGTFARIEQGLQTFAVIMKRGLREQRNEYRKIARYNALFMPARRVYRVLGSTVNPFGEVSRDDFRQELDVVLTADPSFAAPQARKAEAAQLAQTLMQFPVVVGVPEMGIPPNMEMQLDLVRDLLHAYSKPDLIARLPPATKPAMDPKVENEMAVENQPIELHPADDDVAHNIEHLAFLQSPEGRSISPEARQALVIHTQKHIIAYGFKQQQAAMQQALERQKANTPAAGLNGSGQTEETEDVSGIGEVGEAYGAG